MRSRPSESKNQIPKITRSHSSFFKEKKHCTVNQTTTVTINIEQKTDGCFDFLKGCFKK